MYRFDADCVIDNLGSRYDSTLRKLNRSRPLGIETDWQVCP